MNLSTALVTLKGVQKQLTKIYGIQRNHKSSGCEKNKIKGDKNRDSKQMDGVRIKLVSKIHVINFSTLVKNWVFYLSFSFLTANSRGKHYPLRYTVSTGGEKTKTKPANF